MADEEHIGTAKKITSPGETKDSPDKCENCDNDDFFVCESFV